MPRIIGTHHPDPDPQYDRLMKRIMDSLDDLPETGGDATVFWDELEKLRDYVAMRKVMG